jgi:hypothetical protein
VRGGQHDGRAEEDTAAGGFDLIVLIEDDQLGDGPERQGGGVGDTRAFVRGEDGCGADAFACIGRNGRGFAVDSLKAGCRRVEGELDQRVRVRRRLGHRACP